MTYACPMHPEVVRPAPGLCPKCGMNLLSTKTPMSAHGLEKHAGHRTETFLRKFWICFLLTIPVVLYSDLPERIAGWTAPVFPGSSYLSLAFSTIVFFYGGLVFLQGAWRELRAKLPGMMTLISLAILAAYLFSVWATVSGEGETLFWELTTLITVMLFGHWIEMRAVAGARGALKELAKLLPDTAEVWRDGKVVTVSLHELKAGDEVQVRPGGKVPADGEVVEGRSELNESMVTGESRPVMKDVGGRVIAGTINGDGSLKVRVDRIGEQTFLAGVMRLVSEAEASKSRLQVLSDRAALYLTVTAVGAGSITFVAWLLADAGAMFAAERLVAVLVITCPHALGLAVPLVASISTTMAAKNGLLVKRRLALESARNIDIVLFDKTGTLTTGAFGVSDLLPNADSGADESRLLALAASVDARSEHPIAKAIVKEAAVRNVSIQEAKEFERLPGRGSKGIVEGKSVVVGSELLLSDLGIKMSEALKKRIDVVSRQGKTVIYVISEKTLVGAIALADVIREESREAIAALKKEGIKVAMVTGDSEDVAAWVSQELGIDESFARVLPGKKAEQVKALQKRGLKVAMVGDGVNDAPALTQADLGIAIGAGTNVAIESAGIILVRNDPRDIPKIIRLSKLTYRKMIQNLFWATGYNVIALPIAAGALAFTGILLQPAVAAVFMSLSTVIVAVNAMLLKRNKL